MKLFLKYKLLRTINYGVLSVENFNEKKNIQIYNTFLLLVFVNIVLYGLLLLFYKFYYQLFFIFLSFLVLLSAFRLNYLHKIYLSKLVVIQSFIIFITCVLSIFSFDTVFTLYFFLVILYCTLIFTEKETNEKIFFIVQCFILFFIALTSYKNLLPNLQFLSKDRIADMNFISIINLIIFLFTYIYFHTSYQHYREKKYNTLNQRLLENNLKIKHDNINKRKLVSITSSLLNAYFNSYNKLFDKYRNEISNQTLQTKKIEKYFLRLNELNNKIEEIINYQFSKNKTPLFLSNKLFEINSLTTKIIQKKYPKVILKRSKNIILYIHSDLYTFFVIAILEGFKKKYQPNQIFIEIKHTKYPIEISQLNIKNINVLGIQVHHKFDKKNNMIIAFYFFKYPEETAIYHA